MKKKKTKKVPSKLGRSQHRLGRYKVLSPGPSKGVQIGWVRVPAVQAKNLTKLLLGRKGPNVRALLM